MASSSSTINNNNNNNNNNIPSSSTSEQPIVARLGVNKPVSISIRDEPKVFFANERTFLSWLNFTVILVGFAIGLFNFGGADRISRVSAIIFITTAILIMLYSLYKFHVRAYKIRKRFMTTTSNATGSTAGLFYDDRFGPTALCVILAVAMIINYSCTSSWYASWIKFSDCSSFGFTFDRNKHWETIHYDVIVYSFSDQREQAKKLYDARLFLMIGGAFFFFFIVHFTYLAWAIDYKL